MKHLARRMIQTAIDRAPWGVRNAVLDACMHRFGPAEVMARAMPQLGIVEIGADGELGRIRSAWNDRTILLSYARTGGAESRIMDEVADFLAGVDGTYIDIGANIGLTTIPIARNPRVRCIAIEPEPTNFSYLRLNVDQNAPGHSVAFHQAAIFATPGTLHLALADSNLGDHRVTVDGIAGRATIEVPGFPLDDLLPRVAGPLALKIDTQGAEPFVVAGGRAMLARAGLLALEFCPYLMRELGGDPATVLDALAGFDEIALLPAGADARPDYADTATGLAALRETLRTARASDGDYVDVLARRHRRLA